MGQEHASIDIFARFDQLMDSCDVDGLRRFLISQELRDGLEGLAPIIGEGQVKLLTLSLDNLRASMSKAAYWSKVEQTLKECGDELQESDVFFGPGTFEFDVIPTDHASRISQVSSAHMLDALIAAQDALNIVETQVKHDAQPRFFFRDRLNQVFSERQRKFIHLLWNDRCGISRGFRAVTYLVKHLYPREHDQAKARRRVEATYQRVEEKIQKNGFPLLCERIKGLWQIRFCPPSEK